MHLLAKVTACALVLAGVNSLIFAAESQNSDPAAPTMDLPPQGKEVFSVDGHDAFLILPKREAQGSKKPWVWYAPTFAKQLPCADEKWMFDRFLAAGIAVAGVDAGESYGSPKGCAVFTALYKELVGRGFSKKPCLLARSRGGLMLYNWSAENPWSVACIAGIYPVGDLESYPGLAKACGAYEMTEQELKAKLSDNNPIDRLENLAAAHVPIFHIHGDSDGLVPLEQNSGELVKRYRLLGGEATLMVSENQGHSLWEGFFQSQELVDFIIQHASHSSR